MNRRGFLRRLGIGAASVAVAAGGTVANTTAQPNLPDLGVTAVDKSGRIYRYQRMHSDVRKGELIFIDDVHAGMPTKATKRGEYCWVQVAGPATVDVK